MWSETFDRAADSYDDPSLRFFDLGADAVLRAAALRPGQRVLDLATGTGKVARRVVAAVGGAGSVVAVDVSRGMLARASETLADARVSLAAMDGGALAFTDRSFDAVTCGFGISFFRPAIAAMREVARVLVPGGRLALCTPARGAFEPQLGALFEALAATDRPVREPSTGAGLEEPEAVDRLLARARMVDRVVERIDIAHELENPEAFWAVVRGTAWRSSLRGMTEDEVRSLRAEVLDRLRAMDVRTLSVPTIVASASVPDSAGDRVRAFLDARLRPMIARVLR